MRMVEKKMVMVITRYLVLLPGEERKNNKKDKRAKRYALNRTQFNIEISPARARLYCCNNPHPSNSTCHCSALEIAERLKLEHVSLPLSYTLTTSICTAGTFSGHADSLPIFRSVHICIHSRTNADRMETEETTKE